MARKEVESLMSAGNRNLDDDRDSRVGEAAVVTAALS